MLTTLSGSGSIPASHACGKNSSLESGKHTFLEMEGQTYGLSQTSLPLTMLSNMC
jgi:hypothetical protein